MNDKTSSLQEGANGAANEAAPSTDQATSATSRVCVGDWGLGAEDQQH
jgi:hypothetical protein